MSTGLNRSVADQIEHWARIGKIVEENSDLTWEIIKKIIIAQKEVNKGELDEYVFNKVN